jgi:DNA-directed RNA polymerase subunit M/transcription elongation factor TFIIS
MEEPGNLLKKVISNLFGIFLLLFIIVGLVALGQFLYSTPYLEFATEEEVTPEKFSKSIERKIGAEHFHILDETVYTDVENAPVCLQCHGNFCHVKSEKLRSFYNMHTFFLACETCHIRVEKEEKVVFQWFDDKTGEVVKELKGTTGNYGAKIVPLKGGKRMDSFPKKELALEYMKLKDTYTEEDKKMIQDELMAHVSKEPIACEECHQKKAYFDYKALGYNQARSAELSRIEIVEMSKDYEDFHMPTMFDPGVVNGNGKENK